MDMHEGIEQDGIVCVSVCVFLCVCTMYPCSCSYARVHSYMCVRAFANVLESKKR